MERAKGGIIVKKILAIDRSICNGCGICEVICSIKHKHAACPSESRIRLQRFGGPLQQYVAYCQHCEEPICATACLKGAIDKYAVPGLVVHHYEQCFSCGACEVMCPLGAPVYDSDLDAYVTCDLCGGDPVCVQVCPTKALVYDFPERINAAFRCQQGADYFYRLQGREML